uniref:Uncharacterized protein n=1 Tax=Anopheles minimus TaxID=112268 RepID=A0A182WMW2_9DIPT
MFYHAMRYYTVKPVHSKVHTRNVGSVRSGRFLFTFLCNIFNFSKQSGEQTGTHLPNTTEDQISYRPFSALVCVSSAIQLRPGDKL